MQFKYRNQFPFLGMMLALLEIAQMPCPKEQQKQQGQTQNKTHKEFSSNIVLTLKENNSESMW